MQCLANHGLTLQLIKVTGKTAINVKKKKNPRWQQRKNSDFKNHFVILLMVPKFAFDSEIFSKRKSIFLNPGFKIL